jgi:Flp pilus assembly protein TadG
MNRKRRSLRAQGLVEFALILPILLLIIIGTIEFARIFFIYVNLANAAREGARYGMVNPKDGGGIANSVIDMINLVPADDTTLNVEYDSGPGTPRISVDQVNSGGRVIVTLSYNVRPITPLMDPFIPDGLSLTTENRRTIQTVRESLTSTPAADAPFTATNTPESVVTDTATPDPMATETVPPTATDTPVPATGTATSTPTPEPVIPIDIDEPVAAGDTSVVGDAEGGYVVTLRVIQTGHVQTVVVAANDRFSFDNVTGLAEGYTVVVQGYGHQDVAVVGGGATPTPTATPPTAFIYVDEICLSEGTHTVTVHGQQWPASGNNKSDVIRFYWDGVLLAEKAHAKNNTTFTFDIDVTMTAPGPHTLRAEGYDNRGNLVHPTGSSAAVEHSVPLCAVPTPTPESPPDLQIIDLQVADPGPYGTYERLDLIATVRNAGDAHVATLFWIELWADYDPDTPLLDQPSVDYLAVNALAAQSTVSLTMYVPDGFETKGEHTVIAMIDTWDQIVEADETNNVSPSETVTLTIANPEPTPTPQVTPGPTGSIWGDTLLEGSYAPNVTVYVLAEDGRLVASTISDRNGRFELFDIPVGVYSVRGELRIGEESYVHIQPAEVSDGLNTYVRLDLASLNQ